MLAMHPDCQHCGAALPAELPGAFICSLECTFCTECADALDERCPNCGGELLDRPTRARALHAQHPPASAAQHKR